MVEAYDVLLLMQYLQSKGRDCHVNTGVHGKYEDGKFEYVWDGDSGDFLGQDVVNARNMNLNVSFHSVTS